MIRKILNRNDDLSIQMLSFDALKSEFPIGSEIFYLHKIRKVIDCETSFYYDDSEPEMVTISYNDCNGHSMSTKINCGMAGCTGKEIMDDVQHIYNDIKYRVANQIEVLNPYKKTK